MDFLYLHSQPREQQYYLSTEMEIAHALTELGHKVTAVYEDSPRRVIFDMIEKTQPDVLLFAKLRLSGHWDTTAEAPVEFLNELRKRYPNLFTCCWIWDCINPQFSSDRFQWSLRIAQAVDLFCTSDGSITNLIPQACVLRQGVPSEVFEGESLENHQCDVLFLGEEYGDRKNQLQSLRKEFGSRFLHIPRGYHGKNLNALLQSSRIVCGPFYPVFPGYWSNRIYTILAHEALYMGPDIQGMREDDGFIPGVHYIESEEHDYIDQLKCMLRLDSGTFNFTRQMGCIHATRNLTYESRCERLVQWIAEAKR